MRIKREEEDEVQAQEEKSSIKIEWGSLCKYRLQYTDLGGFDYFSWNFFYWHIWFNDLINDSLLGMNILPGKWFLREIGIKQQQQ